MWKTEAMLEEAPPPMTPPQETQHTISAWADETFGNSGSNLRVAIRANQEMAELLRELSFDDTNPKAPAEIADVVIVLSRLATRLGVDLQHEINQKMAINRQRTWTLDGTGCGQHHERTR
jgi:rRNA maturation endonuclease Nob1